MTYVVKEIYYTGRGCPYRPRSSFLSIHWMHLERRRRRPRAGCLLLLRYRLRRHRWSGWWSILTAELLAETIERHWKNQTVNDVSVPYVVFTGGEPALQLDERLVAECQNRGFEVAIETNGTRPLPAKIDWVCVSPKPLPLVITSTMNSNWCTTI